MEGAGGCSRLWTSADGSRVVIRCRRGPRAVSSTGVLAGSLRDSGEERGKVGMRLTEGARAPGLACEGDG